MHRPLLVAALIATTGLSFATVSPVHAATTPAASGTMGGNPVPGVCMLSREAVFAQSKVGQAASERLKTLAQQQQQPLNTDIQAFQQKAASLTEAQRQQQGQALQQRMQSFKAQVEATQGKVMEQIGQQAQPLVNSAYTSHHCGLLLNRDAVLGGNTANDLTPDVVSGLDSRITSLNFNLEPAPTGAAAGN
ncbi:OmpH family outer membrane protein [Rhodanobacter sp. DHG33]|uniref:OmpH family outer membrane protein n=1 Tax=Rhodanobacter sp. DHG33 TaxID=2775921 RepID=UPI001CE1F958|nr:OmpH family outer membrane protein [Rhodanobacter sp. DHG33]